jgi:serine/threonine protein kinase
MPNHFLAAGVYGCVYFPGYTCKGESMKKKWVSKLTYQNEKTTAEIEIGHLLKKVPHYDDHFVLVERSCPIAYKALSEMKEGCDLIKKNKSYVLLYSKFVSSMELYEYLQKEILFTRVLRCFFQICKSISMLIDQKIVHHDLHFSNMLYSSVSSNILIIDFGLSINTQHFNKVEYLKEVFSRYMPEWNWYALEIHILSYMIQHGTLSEKVVHHAIDTYLEQHVVFSLFPEVRTQFKKEAETFFLPLVQWTQEEAIEYLLTFWKTWDYYEIGLRFLYLYADNQVDYPSYLEHLLTLIQANPEKRPNVLQIRNSQNKVIQLFDMSHAKSAYSSIDQQVITQSLENTIEKQGNRVPFIPK